jgi:hypothetical protein
LFHFSFISQLKLKMDIYRIQKNTDLTAVYCNHEIPNLQDLRWFYTDWSEATIELTQQSSPLRQCEKGEWCRVLPSVGLLRRNRLIYHHETSKQWWCENHNLYFLSVQHEWTDRARRYIGEICSRYMFKHDPCEDLSRYHSFNGWTRRGLSWSS